MSLTTGTRLNQYEVTAQLGAGGMGEVYCARDTRLQRNVAIKILPSLFATDAERLTRFEREAQVLASLNHPHIAQIYGVEESAGVLALVMELVDGPTLAELIAAAGGISVEDALDVATQISEALEAAHDQGIIHRDLKPANVKVRPDGVVKVLDFGLAKAMGVGAMSGAAAEMIENSPTFTSPAVTQFGVILGTAAYMAPEQARGKIIDRRVDIWAFGCVLYEMLTGSRPFAGETVTDVLSAIVSREPDWNALPAGVPASVARLLRRCLEKDPRKRLRDIGEARLVLETPHASHEDASRSARDATIARSRGWAIPSLMAVALLTLASGYLVVTRARQQPSVPGTITRFDMYPPDASAALTLVFRPAVALSANGRTAAFVAAAGGIDRVYVRTRSDAVARVIPGSERGTGPALSPDGKWVAFFAGGAIRKAPIDGEAATIGTARDVRGISWSDDGTLFLTADAAAPLVSMPAAGGQQRPVTTLAAGERTHRWPEVLPGGRSVLFTVGTMASPDSYDGGNIDAVMVQTGERRVVIRGAAMARYCGDGRLLYSKGGGLFSIAFDPDRLTTSGEPVQVIPAVARDASTGAAHFSCASDGTLAFVPGTSLSELRDLVWVDAPGQTELAKLPAGRHQEVRISPDGRRAALLGGTSGNGDVWIYEFAAGTFNRLTFTGTNAAPTWSPDGLTVYYSSFDAARTESTLMKKPADGSRDAVAVAKTPGRSYIAWVDPKETSAIVDVVNPASDRGDILRVTFGTSAPPERLVGTPSNEYAGAVSPGGNWLAYESDDTGRPEIYVRELEGSGVRWQVTSEGGEEPHWSSDGRQLFYRSANRLMAVPLEPGRTFRHGPPRGLFDGIYNTGIESGRSYDVNPVTGRFLLVRPADSGPSSRAVRMVLNWALELPAR
ncbi:MAG TPA: protein kinase [Vicinamibacterales bacterium]|nr:protein kinase [Vicinamibacterales bacterium]